MLKKAVIKLIGLYKNIISPLLPSSCRYYPTCSEYSMGSIDKHGVFKGGIMGAARILRCNPFASGGVDYVPEKFSFKKNNKVG